MSAMPYDSNKDNSNGGYTHHTNYSCNKDNPNYITNSSSIYSYCCSSGDNSNRGYWLWDRHILCSHYRRQTNHLCRNRILNPNRYCC
ncbi:MAG: hypothetical protein IKW46_03915 [Bacteroidaceae bacterium]|nr:hypothetical protein [Bacteroidaceae bacterium]